MFEAPYEGMNSILSLPMESEQGPLQECVDLPAHPEQD